jgi:hypothetical protein
MSIVYHCIRATDTFSFLRVRGARSSLLRWHPGVQVHSFQNYPSSTTVVRERSSLASRRESSFAQGSLAPLLECVLLASLASASLPCRIRSQTCSVRDAALRAKAPIALPVEHAVCRPEADWGLGLGRAYRSDRSAQSSGPAGTHASTAPRLAFASLRGYNRPLLFIPGAFPFPRALLRNRRTSRVRSGAPSFPGRRRGAAADRGAARRGRPHLPPRQRRPGGAGDRHGWWGQDDGRDHPGARRDRARRPECC